MTAARPEGWESALGVRADPVTLTGFQLAPQRPDAATRRLVLARDGWRCVCCGVSVIGKPYSLQPRKSMSQGGDNSPSNLITVLGRSGQLCCGRIESRRDPADEAAGFWIGPGEEPRSDPRCIPIALASPGGPRITVWLTPDGHYSTQTPEVRPRPGRPGRPAPGG